MARILLADDDKDQLLMLEAILTTDGHEIVGAAENGADLVRLADELQPDVIITDIVMPEITGIEAAAEIYAKRPTAIIVLSGYSDDELVRKGFQNHVLTYLLKPASRAQLNAAIAMTIEHYEHREAMRGKTEKLEVALEDRKVIERAKGILMARQGVTEDDAHRKLMNTARSKNMKLVEVANNIVNAAQLI